MCIFLLDVGLAVAALCNLMLLSVFLSKFCVFDAAYFRSCGN